MSISHAFGRTLVQAELDPDESILWLGRPAPVWFKSTEDFGPVILGILFISFIGPIIFVLGKSAILGGQWMALWAAPIPLLFLTIGVLSAISPLATRRHLAATLYAITSKRVLILIGTSEVRQVGRDAIAGFNRRRRRGGLTDLFFTHKWTRHRGGYSAGPDGFVRLRDANDAERALRTLIEETR